MHLTTLVLLALTLKTNTAPTSLSNSSPFVINGTDANITDYPWMVSVQYYVNHNCGGSILSPDWILTAAHCENDPLETTVQYGTDTITQWGTNIIFAKEWFVHPDYDYKNISNDIALIRLNQSIPLSETAKPVKLPPKFYEVDGSWKIEGTLTGFGYNETGGRVVSRLQEVDLSIVSNEECSQIHQRFPILKTNLCAGVPEGGKGQCSGDSGGPLTLKTGEQVGIVSWSEKPCAIAPYPGVYTKVSYYIDWIEEVTGLKFS